MKSTDFNESKYFNAKNAGHMNGRTLTIYEVKSAIIGQGEDATKKMLIGFEDVEKILVVNKTNNEILTEAYGDETDAWVGKRVILNLVSLSFKGERTLSIQLSPAPDHQEPIIDAEAPATGSGKKAKK